MTPGDTGLTESCGRELTLVGDRLSVGCAWTLGCSGWLPWIYELQGSEWVLLGKVQPVPGTWCDWFGGRLLTPNLFVGTAPGAHPTSAGGAVFFFEVGEIGEQLHASPDTTSLAVGRPVELYLNAGLDYTDTYALVLGSLTGTSPGFDFGGHHIALEPDAYFLHTLTQTDAPPLDEGLTYLDYAGQMTVTFELPPGLPPALAGLTAWHVMVVPNWTTGKLELASDPAGIAIVP